MVRCDLIADAIVVPDDQHGSRPSAEVIVSMDNVHKAFGGTPVLRGISMDVRRGEVVCIIGPSGSGKSTLLRCTNALTPIDSGTISVCGLDVASAQLDKLALRRKVGMIFQQYNLFPHKSVLQNVMMAPIQVLKQDRQAVERRARELLAKVRLTGKEDSYPAELSGGQQQRVAIARSLAMQPEVMMFDEVTAALDPQTVKEVLNVIRDLAADGMTCMLVTHEMGFAREIADRVYFTDGGQIVEQGTPTEIFGSPRDARTRAFLENVLQ
jgi:polar amino acid transport system ATP-binding protein